VHSIFFSSLRQLNSPMSTKVLWLLFAILVVAKILFTFASAVAPDEAYYWTWSQNLTWSYYDHPPLNAWLIAITDFVFGTNIVGLRAGALLSFAGTLYIMYLFAARFAPENKQNAFLLSAVVFLASPTLFVWTTIVYNDHLLIFLSLAAAYCFCDYLARYLENTRTGVGFLYGGAALLGFAALTKYNAAFMGVAVALLVLMHPKLRRLLAGPHIYAAGLLTISILAPVLIWNIGNEFASFELHLSTRYGGNFVQYFHAATFARYIFSTLLFFGPFLIVPLIALFLPMKSTDNFTSIAKWLFRAVIVVSLATFTLFSARGTVQWYWSDVSYALMILFAFTLIQRSWLVWAHVLTSMIFLGFGAFSYSVMPYEYLSGQENKGIARMHGWEQVATKTNELISLNIGAFMGTTGYPTAGQLSYFMDSTDVYDLTNQVSHFDFVDRKSLPAGSAAIILHDHFGHMDDVAPKFEKMTKIDEITIERLGIELFKYEFYLGEGFKALDD